MHSNSDEDLETQAATLTSRALTALGQAEFASFVIGFARTERFSREEHDTRFRALKIAVGLALEEQLGGVEVDFFRPDARIDFDVHLQPTITFTPVFYAGRYRKLSRTLSASRWQHHTCRGRGCSACEGRGTLTASIEDAAQRPFLDQTHGSRMIFHGMGREDTDVRMLGMGRPFAIEVRSPMLRTIDLPAAARQTNAALSGDAEIFDLHRVDQADARALKVAAAEKTYRAWIATEGRLPRDADRRVAALAGADVTQLSPRRVMKKRGVDTIRSKRILTSRWLGNLHGSWIWEVRVSSGTYVKELVNGDERRTTPSLSECLGAPCHCARLDVLAIHWPPPWETSGDT